MAPRWESSKAQPVLKPYKEDGVVYNSPAKSYKLLPENHPPKDSLFESVTRKWNLATTLELLDPWERNVFNLSIAAVCVTGTYYSYHLLSSLF